MQYDGYGEDVAGKIQRNIFRKPPFLKYRDSRVQAFSPRGVEGRIGVNCFELRV